MCNFGESEQFFMHKSISVSHATFSKTPAAMQARVESAVARFRQAMAVAVYPLARQSCEEVLRFLPNPDAGAK